MGNFFGQLLSPINAIFHPLFFLPVYNILMLIYQGLHSFALAIVILTLLVRAALIPLTRKQLKSSRAMQEIQPKLKQLQAQYKNDPQGLMQAQQALYKEHGVNPASGCLPLVIQMPFLYALFFSFEAVVNAKGSLAKINADIYSFLPKLSAPPDMHFLWTNLAHPDPLHILPVLAGILTFVQLRMAMPVRPKTAGKGSDPTTQATSTMQYIMPFFTVFIGWNFPSGLALYWCITTLFSAVQQYFIAGLGSLFVGIPGLEHLVPEPTVSTVGTGGGSRAVVAAGGSTRALAAPAASPPDEGGLRGVLKQFRETLAAASTQAQVQAEQRVAERAARTDGEQPEQAAETEGGAASPTTPTRERRQRPSKTGPMLVRPESAGAPGKEPLPEQRIVSEAAGTQPEKEPLPEQRIASEATGNGRPSANGVKRSTTPGGKQAGGRQKPKGTQSQKTRGARAKGGR